jgi:predicted O-methyltransferase YrrM
VKQTATAEDYARVFEAERQREYPLIDAFEQRMGYAIDRARLEDAARVLACPIKTDRAGNPRVMPLWQHGRVLYASARKRLESQRSPVSILEIGSAKGYGALCLQWALNDSGLDGQVTSVDVIDPHAPTIRNTVAEVHRPITLAETLEPWPEASAINFVQSTGIEWLNWHPERLHVVFVDGKHTASVVDKESTLILARQTPGDVCIFDDVQLAEIRAVVRGLHHSYSIEYLDMPNRGYAVGVRK